jgi:hypothetical protein
MVEPVAIDYRAPLIYGANGSSLVAVAEDGGPKRAVSAAEARTNARLIATAPTLYTIADTAPVLSKYHGQYGFEVERFIADYEMWSATRRAAMASARGETP